MIWTTRGKKNRFGFKLVKDIKNGLEMFDFIGIAENFDVS